MKHNVSYADIYYTREKSSLQRFRLKIAKYAHRYSIAQAMRKFAYSRNTVRKWLRLYLAASLHFYTRPNIAFKAL